ncbi:Conserved oligomeric Golgi complex subunit 3 [Hondaea fermentalgiana]|uniref:Conserved oligomeric Golgi complex subunit 3 n=1 Tax=Hondaea fermentalgiana TaxID=2315210 RepID=A0A2R5G498_9STRA|nr:Conserved oligomeric Golgi complex subunit 3 [Hondaea fermentalgiana]|eukprot:GBG24608.1 Conserved oligomeric Golgi complex subunit 3 [Hondaea fermentalgiana]
MATMLSSALESCVLEVEEALAPNTLASGSFSPVAAATTTATTPRRPRGASETYDSAGLDDVSSADGAVGLEGPPRTRQVSAASTVLSAYMSEPRLGANGEEEDADPAEARVLRGPLEFWAFERARKQARAVMRAPLTSLGSQNPANQPVIGTDAPASLAAEQARSVEQLRGSVNRLASFVMLCDDIVAAIDKGKVLLGDLENKHETVSEKTSSLHEKCKRLLEEQSKLEKIANEISAPLDYMKELDRLGPLLGLPLPSRLKQTMQRGRAPPERVRPLNPDSPRFFEVLDRVDECIAFIEEHPSFRDYEEYSTKFHQLHLRGLSLIRNLVMDSLEATVNSARAGIEAKLEQALKHRSDEAKLSALDSEISSLLYIQYFPTQAKQLRSYIEQLEKRVHQKDGADLLLACQKAYCVQRLSLLAVVVPRSAKLKPQGNDLLRTLRAACPYLLGVCRMEFKLFHEFFSADATATLQNELEAAALASDEGARGGYRAGGGTGGAASATARSSDPSSSLSSSKTRLGRQSSSRSYSSDATSHHAQLLNAMNRDAFLDMMSELCGVVYDIVRPLVVKLTDLETLCEAVRVIEGEIIEGQIEALGDAGNAMHVVVVQILQDVQERLIYSTSQYISANISGFEPKAEHLDYPGLLERSATAAAEEGKPSSGGALYASCYKTLETTLMCLGLIYRCVEPRTFEELAQEAVTSCAQSLKTASERITAKSTRLDGDLFFIKHLLVLREQISPFNTQLAVKEIELDFSSTASALSDFFAHSRQIFSRQHNAFVELVSHGVPLVREHEIDCKRDLETQLKQACENFIKKTDSQALAQIIAFLHRASKPLEDDQVFQEQDFAKPERVTQMLKQVLHSLPEFLDLVRAKMSLYLANPQTESILFKPVQANVLAALTQMTNCVEANYAAEHATPMLRTLASLRTKVSAASGRSPSTTQQQAVAPPVAPAAPSPPIEDTDETPQRDDSITSTIDV